LFIDLNCTAEAKANKRYIYRTGAAFVSTRLGIRSIPPITSTQLNLPQPRETGGLILAGSYVPKTTAQLAHLTKTRGPDTLAVIEMDVNELIASAESATRLIERVVEQTESNLRKGLDTLVMTSRGLVTGGDELESLAIGGRVAEALVKVLEGVEIRPRFVIAKVCSGHSIRCLGVLTLMWQLGWDYIFRRSYKGPADEKGFDCWTGGRRCAALEMR
jgi:uncharacterized protein YgbK (DUF1537 family)